MNYADFERTIVDLCEAGEFERAESEKRLAVPTIKALLKSADEAAGDYLNLLASAAGEAESFQNFSSFLDDLVADGLIDSAKAQALRESTPANRWF